MQNWLQSYSADGTDQGSVSSVDEELGFSRDRVYNYRPSIPQSAEEASEVLLDRLEQAGRVPSKEKFRRMACNTFIFTGVCPYNDRCVFLHDYRVKAEGVKVRTTRQSKTNSAVKDTFYWPDMTRRDVVRHLDQQGLPTANQMYIIPDAFRSNPSNFHNRGLYSMWAHFVEFCVHNGVFYTKKYRDVTSEPFFQVSAYRENPHVPGAKRLEVFVKLSMGKSTLPSVPNLPSVNSSTSLSPGKESFLYGNFSFSTVGKLTQKEPVMNALLEKQKRKTWTEASFKEYASFSDIKIPSGSKSGVAPFPSPVGFEPSSFSPSSKSGGHVKDRSKSAGSYGESIFRGKDSNEMNPWMQDRSYSFDALSERSEEDFERLTDDYCDLAEYNTAHQVHLSLKSINFDESNSPEAAPSFGSFGLCKSFPSPALATEFSSTRQDHSKDLKSSTTTNGTLWSDVDNNFNGCKPDYSLLTYSGKSWSPKLDSVNPLRYGQFDEELRINLPSISNAFSSSQQTAAAVNEQYTVQSPQKWNSFESHNSPWASPQQEQFFASFGATPQLQQSDDDSTYSPLKDYETKEEVDWFAQLTYN